MFTLILSFLAFVSAVQVGIPIAFDPNSVLGVINRERQFWKIPILDYDDDLAQIAQYTCETCDWPNIPPSSYRGPMLASLKGFIYTGAKWQSTGETRAAAAGPGADPTPSVWLNRQDWICASNGCNGTSCAEYTQVIWKDTAYVGCGKCKCNSTTSDPFPNDNSPDWEFLVCNWNSAGNYAGEHPFGSDAAAVCAGTYSIPPPSPQPTCVTCNDPANCPAPVSGATCNADSTWHVTGPIAISQITGRVACGLTIEGDLTGSGSDRLNMTGCGGIKVTGALTLTGNPGISINYQGVSGITPDSYRSFINYTSISGGTWGTPVAEGVWTPTVDLCSKSVTGSTGSEMYFYDCAVASPSIANPLPQGGSLVGQSTGVETFNPPNPILGGDINNPETNTQPKGPLIPPDNGSSSSSSLPGWAIFLIVLAVLIAIAVIIALIFFLFAGGGETERF